MKGIELRASYHEKILLVESVILVKLMGEWTNTSLRVEF
jgi:hypothetical protein